MDTTERMMIMGMCLQGLLANPLYGRVQDDADIKQVIKLAHQFADAQRALGRSGRFVTLV